MTTPTFLKRTADLWVPDEQKQWQLAPSLVTFTAKVRSSKKCAEETGHLQIDFGLDTLFVQETVELTEETQAKIRENVLRLLDSQKDRDEYARDFSPALV